MGSCKNCLHGSIIVPRCLDRLNWLQRGYFVTLTCSTQMVNIFCVYFCMKTKSCLHNKFHIGCTNCLQCVRVVDTITFISKINCYMVWSHNNASHRPWPQGDDQWTQTNKLTHNQSIPEMKESDWFLVSPSLHARAQPRHGLGLRSLSTLILRQCLLDSGRELRDVKRVS